MTTRKLSTLKASKILYKQKVIKINPLLGRRQELHVPSRFTLYLSLSITSSSQHNLLSRHSSPHFLPISVLRRPLQFKVTKKIGFTLTFMHITCLKHVISSLAPERLVMESLTGLPFIGKFKSLVGFRFSCVGNKN